MLKAIFYCYVNLILSIALIAHSLTLLLLNQLHPMYAAAICAACWLLFRQAEYYSNLIMRMEDKDK